MKKGKLIVFEGIDHSGKGTQIEMLKKHYEDQGEKVRIIRTVDETGFSGKAIRGVLSHPEQIGNNLRLVLMFLSELVYVTEKENGIRQSLEEGCIVLVDRYYFSTIVYSGFELFQPCNKADITRNVIMELIEPDVVIYLDIPPSEAKLRSISAGDHYEQLDKQKEYHSRYDIMCSKLNNIFRRVDARGSVLDVHLRVLESQ
jgi:dTMP kinase